MDMASMVSTADADLFIDSQPMNDEELSRLHESTLQMFRSNKIGPKNAFDIVLIDYLPAIFEATSFDDDHMNNFQAVGTTLETSAKIYAARIDSLYSETRKAQSILRSTNDNMNRMLDDDEDDGGVADEDGDNFTERRISNNKKIRLLMKRKKSIVTDRQKLLRKNRDDEIRPIMINQFFLSAMNNDSLMLSELYEKINASLTTPAVEMKKTIIKVDQHDALSSSLHSNDFACESLYIDTTNGSISSNDIDLSPSSEINSTHKSSQMLTPNSLASLSTLNLSATPVRSRTNSISSNASILTNAANLLTDTPDEYSYLDSSKVHAFMNEIHSNTDEIVPSPGKQIRKRRMSIEYPFPFLVEQVKKQRMTPKKLRDELLNLPSLFVRPPSPEFIFSASTDASMDSIVHSQELPHLHLNDSPLAKSSSVSQRQRAIDFRHLQANMQTHISEHFRTDQDLVFSDIYSDLHADDHRTTSSSADIGICFAALLNIAVGHQLNLKTSDLRDDIRIVSPAQTPPE